MLRRLMLVLLCGVVITGSAPTEPKTDGRCKTLKKCSSCLQEGCIFIPGPDFFTGCRLNLSYVELKPRAVIFDETLCPVDDIPDNAIAATTGKSLLRGAGRAHGEFMDKVGYFLYGVLVVVILSILGALIRWIKRCFSAKMAILPTLSRRPDYGAMHFTATSGAEQVELRPLLSEIDD